MQRLKNAIDIFLKNTGLEKGVNQNKAILIWDDVVGSKIAQNTTPEKAEHGVLTVKATSPAWRQELVFKKKEIINKLNKKLGEPIIREIKFI
ncbi:MAG: DUF721 domain-containing protein [Candidatus Marinimicrobia bacterium]|jgi:predicted nucleic acid-binding Zn ribbon protein|nr:DUF721 domain-containing protein [Candidatus Neomarinimicrobiota bacterium]|tara:strand:+ start:1837 stop:2112 length:276 start_codon:yes stop_codon:yes gene_type:complete